MEQSTNGALGNFLKAMNEKFIGNTEAKTEQKPKQEPKSLNNSDLSEAYQLINDLKNILPTEANGKVAKVLKDIEGLQEKETKKPEKIQKISEKIVPINESKTEELEPETKAINESSTFDSSNRYKLYRDRDEIFECKISVEGSSLSHATARLILEAEPWNIVIPGKIFSDGKCIVHIKKMGIYNEGTVGKATLEVIVDDSIFIPWEETFIIEGSKKVSVELKTQKVSIVKPDENK